MKATRKVSSKAQQKANEYVNARMNTNPDYTAEGQEFDVYVNSRFYTFSFRNQRGYWTAKFEHYGRKY